MTRSKIISNSSNIFQDYLLANKQDLSNSIQPAHSIASFGLQSISFSSGVFAPHTDILCVTNQPLISAI